MVSLAEMPEANPFGEVDGYSAKTEDDNPFGESEVIAEVEDVPTPKTTKSRKKKAPVEPAKEASDLDDILSQFSDGDKVDD